MNSSPLSITAKIIKIKGKPLEDKDDIKVADDLLTILQKAGYVLDYQSPDGFIVQYLPPKENPVQSTLFLFDIEGKVIDVQQNDVDLPLF